MLECLSKLTDRYENSYERSRKNDCKREDTASSSRGGSVPLIKYVRKDPDTTLVKLIDKSELFVGNIFPSKNFDSFRRGR